MLAWALVVGATVAARAAPSSNSLDTPTINRVSFALGSPLGSQRLAVEGSGFATNHADGHNTVEIGKGDHAWVPCKVVEGACTVDCGSSSRIVCDTAPVTANLTGALVTPKHAQTTALDVRVTVCRGGCDTDNPDTSTVTYPDSFVFMSERDSALNPTLLGVSPRQVSAGSALSLTGSRFGNNIRDYRVIYVGSGEPIIGGNIGSGKVATHAICRPQALNRAVKEGWKGRPDLNLGKEKVNSAAVMQEDFEPLPITPDFYKCQLGDFEAGSYNVSVQLPQGLAWSNPNVDTGLFARNANGDKYEVQYFPTITSIIPSFGSLVGGTLVTLRGYGFSMDPEDISISFGNKIQCRVITSTLEEIKCVTMQVANLTYTYNCSTGSGLSNCASCDSFLNRTVCVACNPSSWLVGGRCYPAFNGTISVDDTNAETVHGLVRTTSALASGGTFLSDFEDSERRKGHGWVIFTATISHSARYRLRLLVPSDNAAPQCTPRASNVTVVVYHSDTSRHSVLHMELSTAAGISIDLGSFLLIAPTQARVVVDNSGSHGCVAVDGLTLTAEGAPSSSSSAGCTLSDAANYDPAASSDDGSCLYVGTRGLLRQTWSWLPTPTQDEIAYSSPAYLADKLLQVPRACPRPGEEVGWDFLQNFTANISAPAANCLHGACPSHAACPPKSFCCLTSAHAGCRPNIGHATTKDTTGGWVRVFRQILPERDSKGGYFGPDELSKNADKPDAAMFSILNKLEQYRGDDGMFEFRLQYSSADHIHWKQSINPVDGLSLLNSKFEFVKDKTPMWHKMFQKRQCGVTLDTGEEEFNRMFGNSTFPLVRYDLLDTETGSMRPYAYYRKLDTTPRPTVSMYKLMLETWTVQMTPEGGRNVQNADFRIFGSETEALTDVAPWAECTHTREAGVGFPGSCGATGPVSGRYASKGDSDLGSCDFAMYIYAPAHLNVTFPTGFRGLTSRAAAKHGHLLDGESLDVVSPFDEKDYMPAFGVGVLQSAPVLKWLSNIAPPPPPPNSTGLTYEKWNLPASVPKSLAGLRSLSSFPDAPSVRVRFGPFGNGFTKADSTKKGPGQSYSYGARMYGWFYAKEDGFHQFYVTGDDSGELWLGDDQASATKIASFPRWASNYKWDAFSSQRSKKIMLTKGKMYYIEALQVEGSGGDYLAFGVDTPTQSLRPLPIVDYLYTVNDPMWRGLAPRNMEFKHCGSEGTQCVFVNTAAVQYTLGFQAVSDLYTVEDSGTLCKPFGSGIGGDKYVQVGNNTVCGGSNAAATEEYPPGWMPNGATAQQQVDACRRKCEARADCTHFVSWDNDACFSYSSCTLQSDASDIPGTESLFLNTRRAKGKCSYIPVASRWQFCADDGQNCSVDKLAIVRYGAGKSFTYQVMAAAEGDGNSTLLCSTLTFGLGSPGKRRCDFAYLGVPARIAGPTSTGLVADTKFVDSVELYVKPRGNADMQCQKCDGCIDADGQVVKRNLALKRSVSWSENATFVGAIAATVDGITDNAATIVGAVDNACSTGTATHAGALAWHVDLGHVQNLTALRIWTSISVGPDLGKLRVMASATGTLDSATQCGIVVVYPAAKLHVECLVPARFLWLVTHSSSSLGLCEVEVFGHEPACPSFCVADQPTYPEHISAPHQLLVRTHGYRQNPLCNPQTTACDGEDNVLTAELPGNSQLRLGGSRYRAFFVAPASGFYTFRTQFDDVGELYLSHDANPQHAAVIASSTKAHDGWFGPQADPHTAHIDINMLAPFTGALFVQLLGSSARAKEFMLVRGSAGFQLPKYGGCAAGQLFAEYFIGVEYLNSAPTVSGCENWDPDSPKVVFGRDPTVPGDQASLLDLRSTARLTGAGNAFSVRWTGSVLLEQDGVYEFSVRGEDRALVTVSNHIVINNWHGRCWDRGQQCYPQQKSVQMPFLAGVHTLVVELGHGRNSAAHAELSWTVVRHGAIGQDSIIPANEISMQQVRDIVPVNQNGHPMPSGLGSLRAIRIKNVDGSTCLGSVKVTIRGMQYHFQPQGCFSGELELDTVATQSVESLNSAQISTGDTRIPQTGLYSWFQWAGWDSATQIWSDSSGNDRRATPGPLTKLVRTIVETHNGANASVGYVAGGVRDSFSFGPIIPAQFTICSLTRYTGTQFQGRILRGENSNLLFGHHGGSAGVAYFEGWKTSTSGDLLVSPSTNWVAACARNQAGANSVWVNGQAVGTGSVAGVGAVDLVINGEFGGPGNGDVSEWGVAEVITWNRWLDDAEMSTVQQYIMGILSTGNVPPLVVSSSPHPQVSTPVRMEAGEVRYLELVHANSAGADESLVTVAMELDKQFNRSCAQILADFPSATNGVYLVDPAATGSPFEVVCDMVTDGGGWFELTLANSFNLAADRWHGIVMEEYANTSGFSWSKCAEDPTSYFEYFTSGWGALGAASSDHTKPVKCSDVDVKSMRDCNSYCASSFSAHISGYWTNERTCKCSTGRCCSDSKPSSCSPYSTGQPHSARPSQGLTWPGPKNVIHELKYARPDTGAVYSASQMDALRTQSTRLSTDSRLVAVTSDDDAHQTDGHEIYIYDANGTEFLVTPGFGGNCEDGDKITSAARIWSTDAYQSEVAGVHGMVGHLPVLPPTYTLPSRVRLAVLSSGGAAFGYERRTIRVKPGHQWVPATSTAHCSSGVAAPNVTSCEAYNTWTAAIEEPYCSDVTPVGGFMRIQLKDEAACLRTNVWNATNSTCENNISTLAECVPPNVWKAPAERSYCQVTALSTRAATLTCSTQSNSRVSACRNGYYKVAGNLSTPDRCEPNRCAAVASSVALAQIGYVVTIPTSKTVGGLGTVACGIGFREAVNGIGPSASCAVDGGAFVFGGCVNCSLFASSSSACDSVGTATAGGSGDSTARSTACAPGSFRKGDSSCQLCTPVQNAAPDAVYSCTGEADTRVQLCAPGYHRLIGAASSPDTCRANPCIQSSAAAFASLGYVAATPEATDVAGLSAITCAAGYRPTGRDLQALCLSYGGQFSFSGCEKITCANSISTFLATINTAGISLPREPMDPAVSGLSLCKNDHGIKTGTIPLTIKCNATGEYEKVSGDIVCTACTPIANAAPSAAIECTTSGNTQFPNNADGCSESSTLNAAYFSSDADTCTARTCNAMTQAQYASAGIAVQNPAATTKAGLGTVKCLTGYSGTASVTCPETSYMNFRAVGCSAIRCSGTPSFLTGFDTSSYSLPASAAEPPATGISTCATQLSNGGTPLSVKCNVSGEYELVSGDKVCFDCTPVENAATNNDFPCVAPHQWVSSHLGFCDSSDLLSSSDCVRQRTWHQAAPGYCSNLLFDNEEDCTAQYRWINKSDAFCAWGGATTQTECTRVDPAATTVDAFATSDVLPLSAEFLRVPVRWDQAGPTQPYITVNGLVSACTGSVGCQSSTFLPDEYHTPTVISVWPTSGSIGTVVTIVGAQFSGNVSAELVSVTIGPFGGCDVLSVWSHYGQANHANYPGTVKLTTIKCAISASAMAGQFDISVHVDPDGNAKLLTSAKTMTILGLIDHISPTQGSLHGGTVIVIEGKGFAKFGPYNRVRIGGIACVPRTMKNLECRKDAVSMGFPCNSAIQYAYDPLHIRQYGEWFDFSSATRIECRLSAGVTVNTTADVEVTLIDPAYASEQNIVADIAAATRGSILERITGGCEQLANCVVLDENYARNASPHNCSAVELCTPTELLPVNPDIQKLCASVTMDGGLLTANASCEGVGGGGMCTYINGSADPAACEAVKSTADWNDESWGAKQSSTACQAVPGCAYIPLGMAKFGDSLSFTGLRLVLPQAYTFHESATPVVTRITPLTGMPGSKLELFGHNLGAPLPLTDTSWYMSRWGFFEQPNKVEVFVGEDAPCAVVAYTDTYIRCVLTRNTMSQRFPVSIWVHGAGLAATNHFYKYDLFIDSMSVSSGSVAGGTSVTFTGGGLAAVVKTYGTSTTGTAVGDYMGSSLVTATIKMCRNRCPLFEGKYRGGVDCIVTQADGASLTCVTGATGAGTTTVRMVVEWNGAPYMVECRIVGGCKFNYNSAHTPRVARVVYPTDISGDVLATVGDVIEIHFDTSSSSADIRNTATKDFTILTGKFTWTAAESHAAGTSVYAAVGDPLCSSIQLVGATIHCTLAAHRAGYYQPFISVEPFGTAVLRSSPALRIGPVVRQVVQNTGGVGGGREIAIQGAGLIDWSSQLKVHIGPAECTPLRVSPDPWQLLVRQTVGYGWAIPGQMSNNRSKDSLFYLNLSNISHLRASESDHKFTFKLVWPREKKQFIWRQSLDPTAAPAAYCSHPAFRTKQTCTQANVWMPSVNCYNTDCLEVATNCSNPLFTTKTSCERRHKWIELDGPNTMSDPDPGDVNFDPIDVSGGFKGLVKGGYWALMEGVGHSGVNGDHFFSVGATRAGNTVATTIPGPYQPVTQVELYALSSSKLPRAGGTPNDTVVCRTGAVDPSSSAGIADGAAGAVKLGALKSGVACQNRLAGSRFIMYSINSIHSRDGFIGVPVDNADHLACVRYDEQTATWFYDGASGAVLAFTPHSTDLLVASVHFAGTSTTFTMNAGLSAKIGGMTLGYDSSDLVLSWQSGSQSIQWSGFVAAGTYLFRDGAPDPSLTWRLQIDQCFSAHRNCAAASCRHIEDICAIGQSFGDHAENEMTCLAARCIFHRDDPNTVIDESRCVKPSPCSFSYGNAPEVLSYGERNAVTGNLSRAVSPGSALIITGVNFGTATVHVHVGPNPCAITAQNSTEIRCSLSTASVGGYHALRVFIDGVGLAIVLRSEGRGYIHVQVKVEAVTPPVGSLFGGTTVTLTGHGFPSSTHNPDFRVEIGAVSFLTTLNSSATLLHGTTHATRVISLAHSIHGTSWRQYDSNDVAILQSSVPAVKIPQSATGEFLCRSNSVWDESVGNSKIRRTASNACDGSVNTFWASGSPSRMDPVLLVDLGQPTFVSSYAMRTHHIDCARSFTVDGGLAATSTWTSQNPSWEVMDVRRSLPFSFCNASQTQVLTMARPDVIRYVRIIFKRKSVRTRVAELTFNPKGLWSPSRVDAYPNPHDIATPMQNSIRLSEGSYGRVEIAHNGVWGTICDDVAPTTAAKAALARVVCRELGYDPAMAEWMSMESMRPYRAETDRLQPIWIDTTPKQQLCSGDESRLSECSKSVANPRGTHDCDTSKHWQDVGVSCHYRPRSLIPSSGHCGNDDLTADGEAACTAINSWFPAVQLAHCRKGPELAARKQQTSMLANVTSQADCYANKCGVANLATPHEKCRSAGCVYVTLVPAKPAVAESCLSKSQSRRHLVVSSHPDLGSGSGSWTGSESSSSSSSSGSWSLPITPAHNPCTKLGLVFCGVIEGTNQHRCGIYDCAGSESGAWVGDLVSESSGSWAAAKVQSASGSWVDGLVYTQQNRSCDAFVSGQPATCDAALCDYTAPAAAHPAMDQACVINTSDASPNPVACAAVSLLSPAQECMAVGSCKLVPDSDGAGACQQSNPNVWLNLSAASCTNPRLSQNVCETVNTWFSVGDYHFEQLEVASPVVSTIEPGNGTVGTMVTIYGQHLLQTTSVTIGSKECVVTKIRMHNVTCVVPELSAGQYPVLLVTASGAADFSRAPVFSFMVTITSVESLLPYYGSTAAVGSILGGHKIRVNGNGFPAEKNGLRATVGQLSCSVTQSNLSEFICVTPASPKTFSAADPTAVVDVAATVVERFNSPFNSSSMLPHSAAQFQGDFIQPGCVLGSYGNSINCATGLFDPLIAQAFMSRSYTDCSNLNTACLYSTAATESAPPPKPALKAIIWSEFESPQVSRGKGSGSVDVGENEFNRIFALSPNKIVKRLCYTCSQSHQQIFYKVSASCCPPFLQPLE
jgi:hypothetical protein